MRKKKKIAIARLHVFFFLSFYILNILHITQKSICHIKSLTYYY